MVPSVVGRLSRGVPLACNIVPPSLLIIRPKVALVTPTAKEPTVSVALAPLTATAISFPVFLKPKSPFNVTKSSSVASKPLTTMAVVLLATITGAVIGPMVMLVFTSAPVLLYVTVTLSALMLPKFVGRLRTGVPVACKAMVPFDFTIRPSIAALTPTLTLPAVNAAEAPLAATAKSPPDVFWKPKSPVSVTKFVIVALKPITETAVVLFSTTTGAESVPTVAIVLTSAPVLL